MPFNPLRSRRHRRRSRAKSLAVAGALLGGAAALAKRLGADRLLGGEASELGAGSPAPTAPMPSNYDVGGPPSNTATAVPVPEPMMPETLDEQAEVDAAAAAAGAIGGSPSDYASSIEYGLPADEEERPVLEGGGGESEGMEQAEAELVDAAEPSDTASPYQKQIEDAIEAQDDPNAGEQDEVLETTAGQSVDFDQPGDDLGSSATMSHTSTHEHDDTEGDERAGG